MTTSPAVRPESGTKLSGLYVSSASSSFSSVSSSFPSPTKVANADGDSRTRSFRFSYNSRLVKVTLPANFPTFPSSLPVKTFTLEIGISSTESSSSSSWSFFSLSVGLTLPVSFLATGVSFPSSFSSSSSSSYSSRSSSTSLSLIARKNSAAKFNPSSLPSSSLVCSAADASAVFLLLLTILGIKETSVDADTHFLSSFSLVRTTALMLLLLEGRKVKAALIRLEDNSNTSSCQNDLIWILLVIVLVKIPKKFVF
mmetsp:Transcript_46781/g.69201  ORF Transcript_46781/g.69201 Transcript_46781/m.69201 type:complete len:255 (+) Transcript_46781:713-1477(+)